LRLWLDAQLATVSGKSTIAGAIRYALSRWDGLIRFFDDGRIEIDSNVVERAIRPIALGRKNISSPAPTAAASIGRSSPRPSKLAR
jgi:transposase